MGPCNSHKCHCSRCTAAHDFKAGIDLNHRIDQRIAMREHEREHERDALRREQWKRRARQHHIDQSGCCTGESECPCLNCREYREFYLLRYVERFHKVHIGHDDRGRLVKWIWVRRPSGGWQRKDVQTRALFGLVHQHVDPGARYIDPSTVHYSRTRTVGRASIKDEVIVHETNPNSADNWFRQMFTDPLAYVSRDQATEFYRKHGVETPWADPLPKTAAPEEAKEHPMLTALQLAILSHYIVHPNIPYPYTAAPGFGTVSQALADLIAGEFLEPRPEGGYKITHRTTVYFRTINTLPLPVRKPAPWVMPEPQHGSRER